MLKRYFPGLIVVITASVLFSTCDTIDPPYTQDTGITRGSPCAFPVDTTTVYRKVLVEDYTGHLCGNCPDASRNLYNVLKPLYGDTIITVGVHAGTSNFTGVCPGENSYPPMAPVGSYAVDYRTPSGDTWFSPQGFGISVNPKGMVSRVGYPSAALDWGTWGTVIDTMSRVAKMKLQILNTYNAGQLNTCIKTTFLANMNGTFNLSVILTEDSIIDWQKDYAITPPNLPPYGQNDSAFVHRHVMRGTLNTTYGEQIAAGNIVAGDTAVNSYAVNLLSLPTAINPHNPTLNVAHCHVVAFVFDANTKEVMQVEEERVQ